MRFPFEHLEQYTFIRELEDGALGPSFLVQDRDQEMLVIKIISGLSAHDWEHFKFKFEALQRLTHAHLVPYDQILRHEGHVGLVRPFVEGLTFRQFIQHPGDGHEAHLDAPVPQGEPQDDAPASLENLPEEVPQAEHSLASQTSTPQLQVGEVSVPVLDDPISVPHTPLDLDSLDLERELTRLSTQTEVEIGDILADVTGKGRTEKGSDFAITLERLQHYLPDIASALEVLHRYDQSHGQLHPGNLLIHHGKCIVLDYGLAPLLPSPDVDEQLPTNLAQEVLEVAIRQRAHHASHYMAPEIFLQGTFTPAADIYALGCILFELMTGRPISSFRAADELYATPPSLLNLQPQCPSQWAELVHAMLSPAPEDRPGATELLTFLEDSPQKPTLLPPTFMAEPSQISGRNELVEDISSELLSYGDHDHLPIHIVWGEMGAGKHHLIERVNYNMSRSGWAIVGGTFSPTHASPYGAWNHIVDQLAELLRHCTVEFQHECEPFVKDAATLFPQLNAHIEDPAGARTRLRALRALRTLIAKLSFQRPLLLVLNHLDHADHDARDLLRDLRAEAHVTRCVLVATVDDDPSSPLRAQDADTHVHHARLFTSSEAREFLLSISTPQETELLAHVLDSNHEFTPLQLKELLFDAKDQTTPTQGPPQPLQSIFLKRIERLGPKMREVLEYIALSCDALRLDLLQHACAYATEDRLMELSRLRLIKHTQESQSKYPAYRVSHAIVQQVSLKLMSHSRRQPRYAALAKAYDKFIEPIDPHIKLRYLRGAGRQDKTMRYAERALEDARARKAYHIASDLQTWLMTQPPGANAQNMEHAAELHALSGDATQAAELMNALLQKDEATASHRHISALRMNHLLRGAAFEEAQGFATSCQDVFEFTYNTSSARRGRQGIRSWNNQRLWIRSTQAITQTSQRTHDIDPALAYLLCNILLAHNPMHALSMWSVYRALISQSQDAPTYNQIFAHLAIFLHWLQTNCADAMVQAPRALSLLEHLIEHDVPSLQSYALFVRGRLATHQGNHVQAQSFFKRGLEIAEQLPDAWTWLRSALLFHRGLLSVEQGHLEHASQDLSVLTEREHRSGLAQWMASLLHAHLSLAHAHPLEAQASLTHTMERRPQLRYAVLDAERMVLQAHIDVALGRNDLASERLHIFLDQSPDLRALPTVRAQLLLAKGQALVGLLARQRSLHEPRQRHTRARLQGTLSSLSSMSKHLPLLDQARALRLRARAHMLRPPSGRVSRRALRRALRLMDRCVLLLKDVDNTMALAQCTEARALILAELDDPQARTLMGQAKQLYAHLNQHSMLHLEGWPLDSNLSALKEDK